MGGIRHVVVASQPFDEPARLDRPLTVILAAEAGADVDQHAGAAWIDDFGREDARMAVDDLVAGKDVADDGVELGACQPRSAPGADEYGLGCQQAVEDGLVQRRGGGDQVAREADDLLTRRGDRGGEEPQSAGQKWAADQGADEQWATPAAHGDRDGQGADREDEGGGGQRLLEQVKTRKGRASEHAASIGRGPRRGVRGRAACEGSARWVTYAQPLHTEVGRFHIARAFDRSYPEVGCEQVMADGMADTAHFPNFLEANLARIRRVDPALADRIAAAAPAALTWETSQAGPLSAAIEHEGRPMALASRFDPMQEAERFLEKADFARNAGIVLLGMGLGYHTQIVARKAGADSRIIVFEPDLSLMRAVFERIDHTAWLGLPHVVLADEQMDRAGLLKRVEGNVGILTLGTALLTHPSARRRYPEKVAAFGKVVTETVGYCRTQLATAMVNATRTAENFLCNLAEYAAGSDTNELHNLARGIPAVCVSAGPSLVKNVDLLRDPAVRRHVIVITAQTTLRPLLDRGIRPDFVTALDYHEISRRFYEGLPDLPDVTLIAQPLANHTILDSFPGPVRTTQSRFLDTLLGDRARPRTPIAYGSTVAHLSFYVAQHLGCDPIILIGQDLGFSDGLYYCPGTAIHQVWANELGPFNTLEMMEWQRVVRHRVNLQRVQDVDGRPIFSDEQMLTYLKQFERDFAGAEATVIDATEGGLPKAHTTRMPLAEAIASYATTPVPKIPTPPRELDSRRLEEARSMLVQRVDELRQMRRISQKTVGLIEDMIAHHDQPRQVNELFQQVARNRDRVQGPLGAVFALVNDMNTLGAFRRARADRAILHGEDADSRQLAQMKRDKANIELLIEACDEMHQLFRQAQARIDMQAAATRQPARAGR